MGKNIEKIVQPKANTCNTQRLDYFIIFRRVQGWN